MKCAIDFLFLPPDPLLTVKGKRGALDSDSNNSPPRGPRLRQRKRPFGGRVCWDRVRQARPVMYGNAVLEDGVLLIGPGEQVPGPPAVPTGHTRLPSAAGLGAVPASGLLTRRRTAGLRVQPLCVNRHR